MPWKKHALIAAWSLAGIAWLAQIPVLMLISEKKALLLSLGGAFALTELALYATAGLLGITIVESRQRIWKTIKAIALQKKPDPRSVK